MRFPLPSFPQTQIQNEQFNNEGKNKVSQKRTNERTGASNWTKESSMGYINERLKMPLS